MKKLFVILLIGGLFASCDIKNSDAKVEVEQGTAVDTKQPTDPAEAKTTIETSAPKAEQETPSTTEDPNAALLGFWVGYFNKDVNDDYNEKDIYVDEGFYWNRSNKINIAIDEIKGNEVIGHSVVAGNDRPFQGSMEKLADGSFVFEVEEPGDHKYDGRFKFSIKGGKLTGTWTAFKKIDIQKRKYDLEKRTFQYNPDVMLEWQQAYVDWTDTKKFTQQVEYDEGQFENWVTQEVATATELIYKMNASNRMLTKAEVENLKKGDLTIIRNTIYARHGYSFKNRPLRVFFDAQPWYIPVYADIKADFTDIEKE
ncbi:MAG: YARHG domain-containing protein, partial [Bacteroidota bacterium]